MLVEEYNTKISGQQAHCRHTVVYDRTVENGKCQLFVEYKEYDALSTATEITTEIINMYSVSTDDTKEVIASGKTSWDKNGSNEYQQATGEV